MGFPDGSGSSFGFPVQLVMEKKEEWIGMPIQVFGEKVAEGEVILVVFKVVFHGQAPPSCICGTA
jgi:hypothetical protein